MVPAYKRMEFDLVATGGNEFPDLILPSMGILRAKLLQNGQPVEPKTLAIECLIEGMGSYRAGIGAEGGVELNVPAAPGVLVVSAQQSRRPLARYAFPGPDDLGVLDIADQTCDLILRGSEALIGQVQEVHSIFTDIPSNSPLFVSAGSRVWNGRLLDKNAIRVGPVEAGRSGLLVKMGPESGYWSGTLPDPLPKEISLTAAQVGRGHLQCSAANHASGSRIIFGSSVWGARTVSLEELIAGIELPPGLWNMRWLEPATAAPLVQVVEIRVGETTWMDPGNPPMSCTLLGAVLAEQGGLANMDVGYAAGVSVDFTGEDGMPNSMTTDAEGHFRIDGLPIGDSWVVIRQGGLRQMFLVHLEQPGVNRRTFHLEQATE
ncbi:MAG: carboxypeptidase-like regulatory domain-containing protein, partial [Planctomycetota bacterium]